MWEIIDISKSSSIGTTFFGVAFGLLCSAAEIVGWVGVGVGLFDWETFCFIGARSWAGGDFLLNAKDYLFKTSVFANLCEEPILMSLFSGDFTIFLSCYFFVGDSEIS